MTEADRRACRAGALVYSGRRDPEWEVAPATAAAAIAAFEKLPRTRAVLPDQARLGYRGAWLTAPDGRRWQAYEGVAWLADDRRVDAGRSIERALLESAPPDVLPSEWRRWLTPDG